MRYMGSKTRIAKYIIPIILKDRKSNQYYVEPFVGGANSIDKVDNPRVGADNNSYLIGMFKGLQLGWEPPKEISRDLYNTCRSEYKDGISPKCKLLGYVGFNGSYGGRFYDGGYAGITETKSGLRNYPLEGYNNTMKQVPLLNGVEFINCCYSDLKIPPNSIIYCDPPYKGAKQYSQSFDSDAFWQWCRGKSKEGHSVFVSEYNAPDDFECVWEKEVSTGMAPGSSNRQVEKLFILKSSNTGKTETTEDSNEK